EEVAALTRGARVADGAEQRELLADGRVVVDAPFDLQRSEDRAVFREPQHAQLPVVGRIRASRDPGDHVVALAAGRRHRDEEDELTTVRAGKARRHVVRLDGLLLRSLEL